MKIIYLLFLVLLTSVCKAQLIDNKSLSLEAAKNIVATAVKFAKEKNAPGGAIAIVDAGGHLIYLERLDGTFAAASEVATKKANTAAIFKLPTTRLENAINGGRQALITVGHTFLQGGVPIFKDGQCIGAIGVSGSSSAQQDEDIANAGAAITIK